MSVIFRTELRIKEKSKGSSWLDLTQALEMGAPGEIRPMDSGSKKQWGRRDDCKLHELRIHAKKNAMGVHLVVLAPHQQVLPNPQARLPTLVPTVIFLA